jgi:hypothetical protein
MLNRGICGVLWVCVAGACATPPPEPTTLPAPIAEAVAREGELAAPASIESPDGVFRARVPAPLARPIVEEEGEYRVDLEVGAAQPIQCMLFPGEADLASFVREAAVRTFAAIESSHGAIERRAIEQIDAGAIGGSPFLAVDWIYSMRRGDTLQVAALKQFAAIADGATVYCGLGQIGYASTFRSVVGALVETLEHAEEAEPQPYYREVAVVSVAGSRAGFLTVDLVRDAEGDTKSIQSTSLLVRVGPDTLRADDTVFLHWIRPDATLINAHYAESANGELDAELSLELTDAGWQVEGRFAGKPLSAVWPAEEVLGTWIADAIATRERIAQPSPEGASLSSWQWVPSVDPTRRVMGTTHLGAPVDGDRFTARQRIESVETDVVLDRRSGTATGASMQVGPAVMTIERVFVDGSF